MISSTTSRIQYTLTSANQTVAVPFFFLEEEHLKVVRLRDGAYTVLTLATHYTTTGEGGEAGGAVIFNGVGTAIDDVITILRNVPITQLLDLVYNGRFPSESMERALDRLTMISQMLAEAVSRSIRFQAGEVLDGEMPFEGRAGTTFEFDENGALVFVNSAGTSATAAAASAAAALVSEQNAAISEAAAAAFAGAAYTTATGGTSNALDSAVTAGGVTPTRSLRYVQTGSVGGGDLAIQTWSLQEGTNAEDGISYVRPDDYNAGTNAKVWVRVG